MATPAAIPNRAPSAEPDNSPARPRPLNAPPVPGSGAPDKIPVPIPNREGEGEAGRVARRSLLGLAWVAGGFAALVCATMVYFHLTAGAHDPWQAPQLLALKARLEVDPRAESVKTQIRQLDLEFRQRYRHRLALDQLGGWLLAGGAALLALTARKAADLRRVPVLPQLDRDRAARVAAVQASARWTVAATAGVVALALLGVAVGVGSALPGSAAGWRALAGKTEAKPLELPTPAECQANSPRFRGWDGGGATTQTNFVLAWNQDTGSGVAWKTAIPAPGHNSPVVWGNLVFITGATGEKREVFGYQASTGSLLWRRVIERVAGSPAKAPEVFETTGFAASTGATDGRQLYVIFANGDLAALNFDGVVVWSKALGPLRNSYGHASSLAVWQGQVIVQLDQGESGTTNSKLLALDGATGRLLWSQLRPVPISWATPIVIEAAGQTQIITLGQPWVIANALADGHELWRAGLLENEVVPSPVFAGGLVIAVSPSSKVVALRPDGTGDVTKSHVAWSTEDENAPDVVSPVSNGELVFTASSSGIVTCLDLKTGARVWRQDLALSLQASPALVGNRLFVLGEKGVGVVLEAGRRFQELARSQLPDSFVASPAFADGRVFLRGQTNLYCLGPEAAAARKE